VSGLPEFARWRWERHLRFLQARLSPEGYMGLHLTVGAIVILLAGWSFSEIADGVAEGDFARIDEAAHRLCRSIASPVITRGAVAISLLGSVAFLTFGSVCTAVVLALRRWFDALLALVLTMLGGGLLNVALKNLFQRPRPVFDEPLVHLTTFAFPSGHTMGATLFYIFLAVLASHTLRRRMRLVVICCAALLVGLIGATRIYLGAHFFTDVLAAIVAGLTWLAFCWTAVETLRKWRRQQRQRRAL
jgi:undecaprenyl-diphosphatase